ncbi:hypothetical protein KTAU_29130 [Thermogemmatispora aurantia]|uniref:hypothetical protein n=1 Tax=Thermogemmatispora aurantia TaxID=2045279 RepID=UPI00124DAF92|nr:hypothetical protein [Thermogemmatispora aurantia]GER84277.1 hypothetical protein KTAU_29130 [Thermogemmatispora aurantia]
MTITIALLQGEQARYFVTSSLLGTVQAAPETLQAEAVRAVLWALYRGGANSLSSDSAVSTRTLLHHTRHLLLPFARQLPASSNGATTTTTEQINRQFLERLAEQGDLLPINRAGSHWLPAPPRLIPLGSRYLLAGGLPLHALPGTLQKQITLRTTLRLLPLTTDKDWPYGYQSLTSWLGPQPPSLRELQNAFQQAQLIPVDQGARESTPSQAQVYLPHAPGSQEERWQPLTRVTRLSAGRYLLRRPDRWQPGCFHYSIAWLNQGRILQESQPGENQDIARLCYALDQAAGRQAIARWYGQAGSETLALHLESRLPRREYRLLLALSECLTTERSAPLRYRWQGIAVEDRPRIEETLRPLGLTFAEHLNR